MTLYRIKHIPTGCYYRPVRKMASKMNFESDYYSRRVNSNLSPDNGKVYSSKPNLKNILGHGYGSHFDHDIIESRFGPRVVHKMLPFKEEEWEIEEIG